MRAPVRDPRPVKRTSADQRRVLFVFLDGVGIGPDDPAHNPFLRGRLPWLAEALGDVPTLDRPETRGPSAHAFPLDATLGVDGIPHILMG